MPKVKISEYSATANSNTDVASINIDEGCAPSGINNAIRAVMGHLKDFQQGTNGDPFNGPVNGTVGATTPATGAFTTLSATGNVTLGDASTDTLNVGNGGLVKDASGNVGIGTSTTNGKLTVKNPSVSGNQVIYAIQAATSTSQLASWDLNQTTDVSTFGTDYGAPLAFKVNSTETMRLTSTSLYTASTINVGIGTSSITANLQIQRSTPSFWMVETTSGTAQRVEHTVSSVGVYNQNLNWNAGSASRAFTWSQGGTENMRITSSGTLGVNNTNPNTNYKLVVDGATGGTAAMLVQAGSNTDGAYVVAPSGGGYVLVLNHEAAAGTTKKLIGGFNGVFGTSAVESFSVYNNGNVQNTNNSYGPISDIKVKENIVDATPKLAGLMQVRVVNYNLKGELGYETHKQIGVIAQELEQVFPGLVHETPDQDKDGNDLGTTTKGVKMSVFVPMLIKAMQEQQALITQLTARITALESA